MLLFSNEIKGWILRFIFYGLYLLGLSQLIFLDAMESVEMKFHENSWTERLQVFHLFLIAIVFILAGKKSPGKRSLVWLLAGAASIAIIREFDSFLDGYVFDGAWQTLALSAFLLIVYKVYHQRKAVVPAIDEFSAHPSFGMCLAGFLTTFVFSRMFGRGIFWQAVMEENYIRSVKNAAEESVELLGYALILFAALEYLRMIHLKYKNQ